MRPTGDHLPETPQPHRPDEAPMDDNDLLANVLQDRGLAAGHVPVALAHLVAELRSTATPAPSFVLASVLAGTVSLASTAAVSGIPSPVPSRPLSAWRAPAARGGRRGVAAAAALAVTGVLGATIALAYVTAASPPSTVVPASSISPSEREDRTPTHRPDPTPAVPFPLPAAPAPAPAAGPQPDPQPIVPGAVPLPGESGQDGQRTKGGEQGPDDGSGVTSPPDSGNGPSEDEQRSAPGGVADPPESGEPDGAREPVTGSSGAADQSSSSGSSLPDNQQQDESSPAAQE